MKMLLVVFGLLGITSSFGQDVALKKLYNGIEDLRQGNRWPQSTPRDYPQEDAILENRLVKKMDTKYSKYLKDCHPDLEPGKKIGSYKVFSGSFTRPNSKQKLVLYRYCSAIESYGGGCPAVVCGLAILENETVIANFENKSDEARSYTVKDINQNGLTEIMLVVQSRAAGIWGELDAIQLLEFVNSKPSSLGSFFIGGPPSFFEPTDPNSPNPDFDMVFNPTKICTKISPEKFLQKSFPSNIIYVQKGKVPQFFAEGWEVNCDYLEKGVKAKKVSSLTPIKPVPRAVPLTRLF